MQVFDYELSEYRRSQLVKMDILLNGDKVDALSFIVHREFAYERGKLIVDKLKKIIPRQQFEVPIQAAIVKKLLLVQISKLFVKTSWLNVTVVTFHVNVNSSKNKKPVRNV